MLTTGVGRSLPQPPRPPLTRIPQQCWPLTILEEKNLMTCLGIRRRMLTRMLELRSWLKACGQLFFQVMYIMKSMIKNNGLKRRKRRAKTLRTPSICQPLRVLLIKILMTWMFPSVRRMMKWMLLMHQMLLLVQQ